MIEPIRARWHVARLVRRSAETESAVRLVLEVPTWPGNHAGFHVDIRLTAPDGYQATRSYSLASSGERVIIACRNPTKADAAVDEIVTDLLAGGPNAIAASKRLLAEVEARRARLTAPKH